MTCDKCGRALAVGDFPFCPHDSGRAAVVGDDWPGGKVFENGFSEPTRFYSRSEHAAALAAKGLTVAAKWSGPGDKHLSRMDAPCATTLENAKILLTRGQRSTASVEAPFEITVTDVEYAK